MDLDVLSVSRSIDPYSISGKCGYLEQAVATEHPNQNNICQLANASDGLPTLPIDNDDKEGAMMMMMMRGMTTKNFDPVKYSGRWFEVASLKRGF
ncbi:hypothetical protein Leryth_024974, partial [Lithospermum erythrorhizon]